MLFKKKEECSACGACYNICTVNAIEMLRDEEGFLYPSINFEKCIDCGMCENVCMYKQNKIEKNKTIERYGFQSKNFFNLKKSTSGGAFIEISNLILDNFGIVYGAFLDQKMDLKIKRVTNKLERDLLCGSKYQQCNVGNSFQEIKKDLEEHKKVLFISTPCQVYGLKNFLKKEYSNLLTIDLLCHGVLSERIFKEHIHYLEKKYNSKVINYKYRDKKYGWRIQTHTAVLDNKKESSSLIVNKLKKIFYLEVANRPSCFNCKFSTENRVGDISIGDLWSAEKIGRTDNLGTSVVLINTLKGEEQWKLLKKGHYKKILKREDTLQKSLISSVTIPAERSEFWEYYQKNGYAKFLKYKIKYSTKEIFSVMVNRAIYKLKIDRLVIKLVMKYRKIKDDK